MREGAHRVDDSTVRWWYAVCTAAMMVQRLSAMPWRSYSFVRARGRWGTTKIEAKMACGGAHQGRARAATMAPYSLLPTTSFISEADAGQCRIAGKTTVRFDLACATWSRGREEGGWWSGTFKAVRWGSKRGGSGRGSHMVEGRRGPLWLSTAWRRGGPRYRQRLASARGRRRARQGRDGHW
jgi:hypothetical protein